MSLKELRSATDEKLIAEHDRLAVNTSVGTAFYLEELARRETARRERQMVRLTWVITALTAINLLAIVALAVID